MRKQWVMMGMMGQWGMLEFLFQAMSGCWGMTKASDNVKEMPKDTKQGRCQGVLVSVEKTLGGVEICF